MGRIISLVVIIILVVGGLFYFSSQAEPEPVETIEVPVSLGDEDA